MFAHYQIVTFSFLLLGWLSPKSRHYLLVTRSTTTTLLTILQSVTQSIQLVFIQVFVIIRKNRSLTASEFIQDFGIFDFGQEVKSFN